MQFVSPLFLLLILPWLALVVAFFRAQSQSLDALRQRTSPRFFGQFTIYRKGWLGGHSLALLLAGILLICAAASPTKSGTASGSEKTSSVLLAVDCSWSMVVTDVQKIPNLPQFKDRHDEATALATETVKHFPQTRFGLLSFAGSTVVHTPPTTDSETVTNYLKQSMQYHQQHTGTDFKPLLASIIHLVQKSPDSGFQAVIFTDGEEEQGHDYTSELATLEHLRVPVHCVGIGTLAGANMLVGDADHAEEVHVVGDALVRSNADAELKNTRESRTCRVDKDLKRIAEATGGSFIIPAKGDDLNDLLKAIERTPARPTFVMRTGRVDLSWLFLLGFVVLFLADNLVFDGLRFWKGVVSRA